MSKIGYKLAEYIKYLCDTENEIILGALFVAIMALLFCPLAALYLMWP